MSNFLKGFHGFQMRIDAITEAMHGDSALRQCIAHEFDEQLRRSMAEVRKIESYKLPWRTFYTMATSEEFEHASARMEEILRWRTVNEVTAQGTFRGGMTVIERGSGNNGIYIEGGGYGLRIASRYPNEHAEKRIGNQRVKREDAWTIAVSDHAETLRGSMTSKPSRVDAYSEASAIKALRDMVDRHLGIKMKAVEPSA